MPGRGALNVPQTLAQAIQMYKKGAVAEAERLFGAILAASPNQFDALYNFGLLRFAQGRAAEALTFLVAAIRVRPPPPQVFLDQGVVLNALERPLEALESFDRAIKLKAKFPEAHTYRGLVLASLGRFEEALESHRKALAAKPNDAQALANLGKALLALNRYDEALAQFDRSIAVQPNFAEGFRHRGHALRALKRHDEALASLERAVALAPDSPAAQCDRGTFLHERGRLEEAVACFDRAFASNPDHPEAHFGRGNALQHLRRHEEAVSSYDRALALRPSLAEALANRGNSLRELRQFGAALASFDRALALRPDFPEAHSNRGLVFYELQRFEEALACYDAALAARPDYVDALANRAVSLEALKRFEQARADHERVLALQPAHPFALGGAALAALNLCDWNARADYATRLEAHVAGRTSIVSTFALLGYSDDPEIQLQCARNYIESRIPVLPPPLWNGEIWQHDKVRIAYLSADFRSHATAFLMAELFEKHDRTQFEIIGVSFGADDGTPMRRRLVAAFDQFLDVRTISDAEVAKSLHARNVDVAVDLKGYTQESRPGILAHRPAPVQVNYLGYPGTLGSPYVDYIIGDRFVTPLSEQPYFSEQIVQLPDSYQVNDGRRAIAGSTPPRDELGLPDHGFVFASFNNNWKITPEIFDVWMRLLCRIDGSVLWLLRDNDGAEGNLRGQAERRGVDPSRLIFAARAEPEDHLARHRQADLFLDTLPYNAHTTASDALWAGLPVVTCQGRAFAGRVAASLLNAAGLPELVTRSLQDYEALALRLAGDPAQLRAIKAKLAQNRATSALFDAGRFARHLERAFATMVQTWRRGEPPRGFVVPPIG